MTGPVAAARPLFFRPGSTSIFKQLSGPGTLSRPFPARSFSSLTTTKAPSSSLCLRCRFQTQPRRYLTNWESIISKPPPNDPPKPPEEEPKEASEAPSSSPDQEPVLPELEASANKQSPPESDDASSTQPSPPEPEAPSSTQSSPSEPEDFSSTKSSPAESESPSSEQPPPQPELPSETDSRRTALSHKFTNMMDTLQSRVLVASQTLNDLTGYSAIEAFKLKNAQLEADLATAQETLRHSRAHYKAVNAQRASTQREVTTLLARKDTWSPLDLERFTTLYRQDHELETAVQEASTALTEAEADEARLSQALNSGILRRYHEEQIWSDRIRRQSTWGTWGLMGVNVLLFLVLQFVAEPWKRNRLMRGIAAEEKAALEAVRRELEEVKDALVRRDEAEALAGFEAAARAVLAQAEAEKARQLAEQAVVEEVVVEAVPSASLETEAAPIESVPVAPAVSWEEFLAEWKEFLADPSLWRPAMEDLYSERRINLRMRDASLLALEGAVTGAAIIGSIALIMMRRS